MGRERMGMRRGRKAVVERKSEEWGGGREAVVERREGERDE